MHNTEKLFSAKKRKRLLSYYICNISEMPNSESMECKLSQFHNFHSVNIPASLTGVTNLEKHGFTRVQDLASAINRRSLVGQAVCGCLY